MACKGYCEKRKCCDCTVDCKVDMSIPCSPDCENLTPDGKILVERCIEAGCDAIHSVFKTMNEDTKEILETYGKIADYPY